MKIKSKNQLNQIKHNHQIYTYFIGSNNVRIYLPSGQSRLVDKYKIKGIAKPSFFKRMLSMGRSHFTITQSDMEKYIVRSF